MTRRDRFFLVKFFACIALISGSQLVHALDLTSPVLLENTLVLPEGVRNPRFINVFMSMDARFNGVGTPEPLGNPINRVVRWGDLIQLQASEVDRGAIRSTLSDAGLDPNGSPGNTVGMVNTFFNVKVPAIAFGITDRLTVATVLPIMSVSASVATGFVKSGDGQKWVDQLCDLSVEQCNSAAQRLNNAVSTRLSTYGYKPIQSQNFTRIGDVQLLGKYLAYQDPFQRIALKSVFTFPTGTVPDVNAAMDIPTGDGRFKVSSGVVYDRALPLDLRWSAFGEVTALLPNQMDRRIPLVSGDAISPDQERLTRNLGSMVSMGTGLSYVFSSVGLLAGAGYGFQFMTKPTYSGRLKFASERYEFLEGLTPVQALHSVTVTVGFSTVEWYQQKKFAYPFQAQFLLSHPLLGRNVTTNDVFSGELVLFF